MHELSARGARLYSGCVRALGLLLALVALVAIGCGGEQGTQETTAAPPAETETQPRDKRRAAAPPVEGQTLDGEPLALADFRGKPVLVNVWSAW
jgi:cytochrome oxidase Cu insertion factor (SCO1/SenC/PrrC family)